MRLDMPGRVLDGNGMRRELRHQRFASGHGPGQLGELAEAC